MGERESLPIDTELDFSGLEWQGDYPFRQPVRVKGAVALTAEIVMLRARVSYVSAAAATAAWRNSRTNGNWMWSISW